MVIGNKMCIRDEYVYCCSRYIWDYVLHVVFDDDDDDDDDDVLLSF